MEITEDVAEILVKQNKMFSENFQKLLKVYAKIIDENQKPEIEKLVVEINEKLKGHSRAVCVFVLAYLIAIGFSLEDYTKIDNFIGNFLI